MSNQEIKVSESTLDQTRHQIEEKYKKLNAELKKLKQELKAAVKSHEKLPLLNSIDAIEEEIKKDLASFPTFKKVINYTISEKQKQEYEEQTKYYRYKAAFLQAQLDLGIYSPRYSPILNKTINNFSRQSDSINIRLLQLNELLDLLMGEDFLDLVEMVEAQKVNKVYLSSHFLSLYQVWKDLDKIEKTIQDCHGQIIQFDLENQLSQI
ncbi:hypothetical protein [Cyanothece sp. BG0011]|uniref:hypothetical protein n=1 Tax=Cyanothece sp. BG0011 TaxID=2082950 RepID=UPI000D1DA4CB|nr:hypothetical protein [Cyanothece sp. BG0011]